MSRISFFQRFENIEQINQRNAQKLDESLRDISSGKKVRKPSDDPTALVKISRFKDQLRDIEQFKKNVDNGKTFLQNSEAAIKQVSSILQRVRELAVQGASDNLTKDDREQIAKEVDQRLEQVVNIANTRIGEKFLFGGAETELKSQPFKVERNSNGEIIDVTYQGDLSKLNRRFGQREQIPVNIRGNEVFQATKQGIEGGFQFNYPAELTKKLENTVGFDQLENPPNAQTVNAAPANDPNTTVLQVNNPTDFSVGETVRVFDSQDTSTPDDTGDQGFEKTVVTAVNPGSIEVDLRNTYQQSENPVVESARPGGTRQQINNPGTFGGDTAATIDIPDVSNIETGDKVRIENPATGDSEVRVVQAVNPGPGTIEVDLASPPNTYGPNTTVQKVAEKTQPEGKGFFKIDDEKYYYDTSEDSILDIARKINRRNSSVEAKFVGKTTFSEVDLENTEGPGSSVKVEVNNASQFAVGQKVIFEDADSREQAKVTDIRKTGPNAFIEVDNLSNTYDPASRATVRRRNDTGSVKEYSPDEVTDAADGPYKFKIESRDSHQVFMKDFDRQEDNTPSQVEGLLNDLQFLGDGEGGPPKPRSEQNFPNPYHDEATVTGKSVFDTMIDLRESLQKNNDADSGRVTVGGGDVGGEARTRRDFDPFSEKTLQSSLGELKSALDSVISNQSKIGARLNRLETADSRLADFKLNIQERLSQLEDVDLAEAISDFQRRQQVQQASLRVASQISRLSLANFI